MAAKWQQWMPLYLNELRGSMFFRALPDAAKVGYLFLLMAQWETEDGALSDDPEELAMHSGLGDSWAEFGALILRKFEQIPGGKVRNVFMFEKWEDAHSVYLKRRSGGGHHADSAPESGAQSGTTPHQSPSADSHTVTETVTETVVPKNNTASRFDPEIDLPAWISGQTWKDFEEMRKKIRKPMTDRARRNILTKLEEFRGRGHDPETVLNNAINGCWTTVWEPREEGANARTHRTKTDGNIEAGRQAIESILRGSSDGSGFSETGDSGEEGFGALRASPICIRPGNGERGG